MTNRERIEENYEDALFALWMDDFARRRGEQLLEENERLMQDPNAAVPEDVRRRNLRLIRREVGKANRVPLKAVGRKALHLVAIAALVALLFTAAFALSPQFRAGTLNLLMQIDESFASFQFSEETAPEDAEADAAPNVTIEWLPEGYMREAPITSPSNTTINYSNESGDTIQISVFDNSKTYYTFDLEDVDYYEEISVLNTPALLAIKDNVIRISWADSTTNCFILVLSTSVDADTLYRVAESISVTW